MEINIQASNYQSKVVLSWQQVMKTSRTAMELVITYQWPVYEWGGSGVKKVDIIRLIAWKKKCSRWFATNWRPQKHVRAISWGALKTKPTSLMRHVMKGERLMKEAVDRNATASSWRPQNNVTAIYQGLLEKQQT